MTSGKIEHCVEQLCLKGCRLVWDDIALLEQGVDLPETAGLNQQERTQVLSELKSIMAVYEGSCQAD